MAQNTWQDEAAGAIGDALHRLDQAMRSLEERLIARLEAGPLKDQGVDADERRRLADALEAARARERALEEVAAEASAALGRAAAEVRAALAAENR